MSRADTYYSANSIESGYGAQPPAKTFDAHAAASSDAKRRNLLALGGVATLLLLAYHSRDSLMGTRTGATAVGGLETSEHVAVGVYPNDEPRTMAPNTWRIGLVTDLDELSKVDDEGSKAFWRSYYVRGTLTRNDDTGRYAVVWDDEADSLRTRLNLDGRGMELSWLQRFNGHYYAGDDRAGIVFDISTAEAPSKSHVRAAARYALADGDGFEEKGFKSEWATVKDGELYIGSFGKEWSNDEGVRINGNPMFVKVISANGGVRHENWERRYEALREATGHTFPGYLFHESCAWNAALRRWFFVPRRASKQPYNPDVDETKGSNIIYSAAEDFSEVKVSHVAVDIDEEGINTRGYSEIKFVPTRETSDIVALRSEEYQGRTRSWLSVFAADGTLLLEDTPVGDYKFEGLEISNSATGLPGDAPA